MLVGEGRGEPWHGRLEECCGARHWPQRCSSTLLLLLLVACGGQGGGGGDGSAGAPTRTPTTDLTTDPDDRPSYRPTDRPTRLPTNRPTADRTEDQPGPDETAEPAPGEPTPDRPTATRERPEQPEDTEANSVPAAPTPTPTAETQDSSSGQTAAQEDGRFVLGVVVARRPAAGFRRCDSADGATQTARRVAPRTRRGGGRGRLVRPRAASGCAGHVLGRRLPAAGRWGSRVSLPQRTASRCSGHPRGTRSAGTGAESARWPHARPGRECRPDRARAPETWALDLDAIMDELETYWQAPGAPHRVHRAEVGGCARSARSPRQGRGPHDRRRQAASAFALI